MFLTLNAMSIIKFGSKTSKLPKQPGISSLKEVHADSSDSNKLFLKYGQAENEYDVLIFRGYTRNAQQNEPKFAYPGPLKLL